MQFLNLNGAAGSNFGPGWLWDAERRAFVVELARDGSEARAALPFTGGQMENLITVMMFGSEDERSFLYIGHDESRAERISREFNAQKIPKYRSAIQGFGPIPMEGSFSVSNSVIRGNDRDGRDRLLLAFTINAYSWEAEYPSVIRGELSPRPATILKEVSVLDEKGRSLAVAAVLDPMTHLVIRLDKGEGDDYNDDVLVLTYYGRSEPRPFQWQEMSVVKWMQDLA